MKDVQLQIPTLITFGLLNSGAPLVLHATMLCLILYQSHDNPLTAIQGLGLGQLWKVVARTWRNLFLLRYDGLGYKCIALGIFLE